MKSKYLKYATAGLVFCLCFIAGLWVFAPWEAAGRYALDKFRLRAASNGMFISFADFETRGVLYPTYTFRDIGIDQGMVKFTLEEAKVKILPLSSLFFGGASCHVSFQNAAGTLITNSKINISEGDFKLSVSGSTISVANAEIKGDLRATGRFSVDRPSGRVTNSTLSLRLPANIDSLLRNSPLSGKIYEYAEFGSDGEWRIKQNATPNS